MGNKIQELESITQAQEEINTSLQNKLANMTNEFKQANIERHRNEQYRNNNKLEFGGIPASVTHQACKSVAHNIITKMMGLTISQEDIDIAHKLANGDIVVQCCLFKPYY